MLIKKLWMNNSLRNYNYIVACPDSREALAIDPLDHDRVLKAARDEGWTITQVLNTHEHGDHIAGNQQLVRETGAPLLAPAAAAASGDDGRIRNQDTDDPLLLCTLDMERQHNVFFRLDNEEIIANLRKKFPEMSNAPDAEEVFIKLRQLRNDW